MQSNRKVGLLDIKSDRTIHFAVASVIAAGRDRRYCPVRFLQGVAHDISIHIGSGIERIKDDQPSQKGLDRPAEHGNIDGPL